MKRTKSKKRNANDMKDGNESCILFVVARIFDGCNMEKRGNMNGEEERTSRRGNRGMRTMRRLSSRKGSAEVSR